MEILEDIENAFKVLKVNVYTLKQENKDLKKQIKKLREDLDNILKKIG